MTKETPAFSSSSCIQYVMIRFSLVGRFFTDIPHTETRTSRLGGFPGRDEIEIFGYDLFMMPGTNQAKKMLFYKKTRTGMSTRWR